LNEKEVIQLNTTSESLNFGLECCFHGSVALLGIILRLNYKPFHIFKHFLAGYITKKPSSVQYLKHHSQLLPPPANSTLNFSYGLWFE